MRDIEHREDESFMKDQYKEGTSGMMDDRFMASQYQRDSDDKNNENRNVIVKDAIDGDDMNANGFMRSQYKDKGVGGDDKKKILINDKSSHKAADDNQAFMMAQYTSDNEKSNESKVIATKEHPTSYMKPPKEKEAINISVLKVNGDQDIEDTIQARRERVKKKREEEYQELLQMQRLKDKEEALKHKAWKDEIEYRRRQATLATKARQKRNAIFASQRNGLRKRLIAEWEMLNSDQKASTRALRARRNIKCEKCGSLGYFTEICPNDCYVRDDNSKLSEIESMLCKSKGKSYDDEEYEEKAKAGAGYLWGQNTQYTQEKLLPEREKIHRGNMKANLNSLKDKMRFEKNALRKSDAGIPGYSFNAIASDGYSRDLAEQTLHKVLRFLMRTMEVEMMKNAEKLQSDKDYDLFHPPFEKPGSKFYPPEIWDIKEHREYLTGQEIKKERKVNQAHHHHGAVRPDDALGDYFRGGGQRELSALHAPNSKAGQSMHSKIGWKSVLSHSDDLAIADPTMQSKLDNMEKLMQKQKAWTVAQRKAFENTNERFLHMWHIVNDEITKEHTREYQLLSADEKSNLYEVKRNVWKERLDAADRIIDTMSKYHYINGTNEADYVMKCLKNWRRELINNINNIAPHSTASIKATNARKKKKPNKKKQKKLGKRVFTNMGLKQREDEENDSEGGESNGDNDDISISSLDTETRMKLANVSSALLSSNDKGGYKGLGFASEFEVGEQIDSYDCNAAITAAWLDGGVSSLFENKTESKPIKKPHPAKSVSDRKIYQELKLKPSISQHEIEKRKMAQIERNYIAVGMERNIRHGSNEDNSQCTPSLIPIHSVFSATRNDYIKSKVADEIVLRARLSRTDGVTGHISREYVPMYVRNTLFEENGCTEGGDQTYKNMGKDSRYSAQLGRAMQSIEPSRKQKNALKKKLKLSTMMKPYQDSTKGLPKVEAKTTSTRSNMKW